jgi:hypothetical protein
MLTGRRAPLTAELGAWLRTHPGFLPWGVAAAALEAGTLGTVAPSTLHPDAVPMHVHAASAIAASKRATTPPSSSSSAAVSK